MVVLEEFHVDVSACADLFAALQPGVMLFGAAWLWRVILRLQTKGLFETAQRFVVSVSHFSCLLEQQLLDLGCGSPG